MGGISSKDESQQVMIVGPQKSGKTLLFKRFIENRKEIDKTIIDSTLGYNHTTTKYSNVTIDIWDLGGDFLTKSYWPTFYRNLRFTLVIYVINIIDESTHSAALKDLLILLNEEELKLARFFIFFNLVVTDEVKLNLGENIEKEFKDQAEELIDYIKESNVHEFEFRVSWDIMDLEKLSEAECVLLRKRFIETENSK